MPCGDWRAGKDSNPRPSDPKSDDLPAATSEAYASEGGGASPCRQSRRLRQRGPRRRVVTRETVDSSGSRHGCLLHLVGGGSRLVPQVDVDVPEEALER